MPARDYQQECIDLVDNLPPGRYLVQMATGLGKTYTFTHLKRTGRTLILSHREELVRQPLHWYDCETGVEMAASHASPTAEVVSASVKQDIPFHSGLLPTGEGGRFYCHAQPGRPCTA